ncbi:protein NODULATION SIGNALING PATHWAY 2-like [Aristolochia californica]|uniref:protein NODULATION SIGNALING PATHWAY 2-like n=1 Tax=Aristolochia californica TaxID=171875 RepID=UPI0035E3B5D3
MMMDSQFLAQPSWVDYCFIDFDTHGPVEVSDFQFSSSLDSSGDSPDFCSIPCFSYPRGDIMFTAAVSDIESIGPLGEFSFDLDEFDVFSNAHRSQTEEKGDVSESVDTLTSEYLSLNDEGSMSQSMDQTISFPASAVKEGISMSPSTESSTACSSNQIINLSIPVVFPELFTETVKHSAILNLLKAHGDAMDKRFFELGEVIVRRICQMVTPTGASLNRFGYYLFRNSGKQRNHLNQESSKNYKPAFRAFYDICPYGRLAHFVANGTILESIPVDTEIVHIVDFDMREGLQWPPLIEAVGRGRLLRITSIRFRENTNEDHLQWSFQETQRNLLEFSRSRGFRITVDEMDMEELAAEKKRIKKRGGRKEWMVFNCMTDLPQMGKKRHKNTTHVWNFQKLGKEILSNLNSNKIISTGSGIIVFGNGDGLDTSIGNEIRFGRHFDGCLQHFSALLESMEWHFPSELSDARITMESLFVVPSISSLACFDKWEETREAYFGPPIELETWRLSNDVLQEAMEMVRGRGPYTVKIAGEKGNEMVLEWRGTPLVKVSAWR